MSKLPKYLSDAIPNFIGGLGVAIVLALASWLIRIFEDSGPRPLVQTGLAILWGLWVIWMVLVILWAYNRYRHSRVGDSPLPTDRTREILANIPNDMERASSYYSCFISYSHADEKFARQLHDDLENAGVECWFAPDDMKIGAKIRQAIEDSIYAHSKLLLILSEHSLNSDWVEGEAETVFEIEDEYTAILILFPIRLDDAVMDTRVAWAAHIRRTRHIGDFRQWENQEIYQKSLQRVLRDLGKTEMV